MSYPAGDDERLLTGHTGRLFLLLTGLLLGIRLARRLLPPLLPTIIGDLGITAFLAGLTLTTLGIVRAGMEYPGGRLADQLSRTTVLLVCIGLVVAGLVLLSIAVTFVLFVLGIVVFGFGSGLFTPSSRALLSDIYRRRRGLAFGVHLTGSDLSGVLGAGVAVLVVSVSTWRGAFLPLGVLLALSMPVLYVTSREPVVVAPVELDLQRTGLRLLADPTIRWMVVIYSLFVFASGGMISFMPTFLIEVHAVSFGLASAAFGAMYVVGLVAKPAMGSASDRLPRPPIAAVSLVLAAVGLGLVIAGPAIELVLAGVVISAIGQRSVPPTLQAFLMDRFPDESMGGDLGAVRTAYMLVGSFGPGFTGYVASAAGFVTAFGSLLVLFLGAGAVLAWFSIAGWPTPD